MVPSAPYEVAVASGTAVTKRWLSAVRAGLVSVFAGPGEDVVEHLLGQPAGEGVLLARVVRRQHEQTVVEHTLAQVPEPRRPDGHGVADSRKHRPDGAPGESAQRDDHT